MIISKKILLVIFLLVTFIFNFAGCGIPQVLPTLNIPIADKNSYTIEDSSQFDILSIIFTCTNRESYFYGYYLFYRDSSNFLNQASFCYFDNGKWIVVDSIPLPDELEEFRNKIEFSFTLYFDRISYPPSSNTNGTIKDTYIVVQKDNENNLSDLYVKDKSLIIYLIPVGLDTKGPYVYTPAFSTTSNRVIFNFK